MSQQVRYQLWIVAAGAVIFFTNLGGAGLWDMDEALYSSCAREMMERNDWVVPWFNGQMFPEKPPLMFWSMIAGFELFGAGEFGARFFSAVFGIVTALAAFHLGRILFNVRVGLWTGLITASTIIFTISARAATVDSALTLVTTSAFLMFVIALSEEGGRRRAEGGKEKGGTRSKESASPPSALRPPLSFDLRFAIPMYAFIGLAVLAKGPVGMVLPLGAMGLYLLVANGWRNVFRSVWWMRPLTAIVVVAAVALPWYVWVGVRTDGQWLRQFFIEFNLRPFKQPILTHGDVSSLDRTLAFFASFLYYFYQIPAILLGFFPWSVFLGPTVVDVVQRIRRRESKKGTGPICRNGPPGAAHKLDLSPFSTRGDDWRDGCILASCWFGVWFVFWSVCKTKLPHYLLPAYPALAMLTACFIDRWQTSGEKGTGPICAQHPEGGHRRKALVDGKLDLSPFPRWWLRNAWISMILAGLGMMIAIPIVASIYLPGEEVLGLVGVIPLAGGAWCWWKTTRQQHRQAVVAFTVTAVVFLTVMFGWGASRVDRRQNAQPMIAAIRAHEKAHEKGTSLIISPIATYRFFRESTVYYAGHPVTRCEGDDATAHQELKTFLDKSPRSYVITTDEHEPELFRDFPDQLKVIFRQRRFLADGEMVVLAVGD